MWQRPNPAPRILRPVQEADTKHRNRTYRVLDAGCGGGHSILDLPENALIIGMDESELALERNTVIDEGIVGDLQSYPLERDSFDEIICWDVLEHIPAPDKAFANLAQALKPGGRLTIGVPNLISAKGLITKFTPLRFHVWVYKRFFPRVKHAGEPGYGPWKTYLRWSIRPAGLAGLARRHGLVVETNSIYVPRALKPFWERHRLVMFACRVLVPFRDPRLTECKFVARKPERPGLER